MTTVSYVPRNRSGSQIYLQDGDKNEIYSRDESGRQIPSLDGNNKPYYAKTVQKNEYYPQDENHVDYLLARYAVDKDSVPFYPLNQEGRPAYPLRGNTEIYFLKTASHQIIFGKDKDGHERYARDENHDEYYPDTGQIAMTKSKVPTYAVASTDDLIFPTDASGNELYLATSDILSYNVFTQTLPKKPRYAIDSEKNEFYPLKNTGINRPMEMILNDRYAKRVDGTVFYPVDEYGNEYVLDMIPGRVEEDQVFPNGLAVSSNGFYIVPNVGGKPYLSRTLSNFELKFITHVIYRDLTGYLDFLTLVKAVRPSRKPGTSFPKKPFQWKEEIRPEKPNVAREGPVENLSKPVVVQEKRVTGFSKWYFVLIMWVLIVLVGVFYKKSLLIKS